MTKFELTKREMMEIAEAIYLPDYDGTMNRTMAWDAMDKLTMDQQLTIDHMGRAMRNRGREWS